MLLERRRESRVRRRLEGNGAQCGPCNFLVILLNKLKIKGKIIFLVRGEGTREMIGPYTDSGQCPRMQDQKTEGRREKLATRT